MYPSIRGVSPRPPRGDPTGVALTYLFALVNIALLIIVHEFGHLVVAKLCGVAVPVFSVGFGRRLVGIELGGTDYRLSSIPFGGYVRMAGADPYGYFEEDEEHIDPERGFLQRPLWQRIASCWPVPRPPWCLPSL